MGFGGLGPGSWAYHSESDPRWNIEGTASVMSAFFEPSEATAALKAKQEELGCEPPDDLTISTMKD